MSGRFRDMADIQQDSSTDDNPAEDFTGAPLYEGVPCDITAVSGGESFRGRAIEEDIDYIVELHALPNVVSKMSLNITGGIHAGKVLNINATKYMDATDGRLPKLELDCVHRT